jgi:hypothetical protein
MSNQSVVVKTRKFMKNPLLSRRQVRRWMSAAGNIGRVVWAHLLKLYF